MYPNRPEIQRPMCSPLSSLPMSFAISPLSVADVRSCVTAAAVPKLPCGCCLRGTGAVRRARGWTYRTTRSDIFHHNLPALSRYKGYLPFCGELLLGAARCGRREKQCCDHQICGGRQRTTMNHLGTLPGRAILPPLRTQENPLLNRLLNRFGAVLCRRACCPKEPKGKDARRLAQRAARWRRYPKSVLCPAQHTVWVISRSAGRLLFWKSLEFPANTCGDESAMYLSALSGYVNRSSTWVKYGPALACVMVVGRSGRIRTASVCSPSRRVACFPRAAQFQGRSSSRAGNTFSVPPLYSAR